MFCLRSWLPLLFIPTNASPSFIFLFFICTYFLNRPCLYCSVLLLILFLTSCNWSDRCFFDFGSNWFQPRTGAGFTYPPDDHTSTTSPEMVTASAVILDMVNTTAGALATAAADKVSQTRVEWTGLGLEWLRGLLGKREWRVDCLDLYIRL
ncbi:bladder cancer-related protein BC10-domain-containing protein [Podospora conica]|nr:bladder cancer-related protein BC10-domain-containing protein [Schizothecium conicum]